MVFLDYAHTNKSLDSEITDAKKKMLELKFQRGLKLWKGEVTKILVAMMIRQMQHPNFLLDYGMERLMIDGRSAMMSYHCLTAVLLEAGQISKESIQSNERKGC